MTCEYQPRTYKHLKLIASLTFSDFASNHPALCALPTLNYLFNTKIPRLDPGCLPIKIGW